MRLYPNFFYYNCDDWSVNEYITFNYGTGHRRILEVFPLQMNPFLLYKSSRIHKYAPKITGTPQIQKPPKYFSGYVHGTGINGMNMELLRVKSQPLTEKPTSSLG